MSNTSNPNYENLIQNKEPINEKDPAYEQILKDLQGGIIKNYGRKYALYLFIQFDPNKVHEVKQWIGKEIASSVTSTCKQLADTETFKAMRRQDPSFSGELCKNFLLSYQGYETLRLVHNNEFNSEPEFESGMKNYWEDYYRITRNPPNDYWYNPPERWDVGKDRIDALISLAHNSLDALKNEASAIINRCAELGKVTACEAGYHLKDSDGKYIGAFGFAEGISQPLFLECDYDDYRKKQDISQWDPKASLSLVLVKDTFSGEPYSYGSYCVWQKIETNYGLFEKKVGELAEVLECDLERAYALVIGRFKDGTPLALSDQPTPKDENPILNSFNYANDRSGIKCPIQAHIRKLNPRKDDASKEEDRKKDRIFRAGITYFDDLKAPKTSDMTQLCLSKLDYLSEVSTKQVEENIESIDGVLFVCFQSSISTQFLKLQMDWADDRNFPRNEDKYLEPIVGHPATVVTFNKLPEPQDWPRKWNTENQSEPYPFFGCVKAMGGEFLFAPSISFLKNLS